MSKVDGVLQALNRLGLRVVGPGPVRGIPTGESLQPGWLDVFEQALSEHGYYLAPIQPAGTGPAARKADPRTSQSAAAAARSTRAGSQRHKLLAAFAHAPQRGMTDEEAMEFAQGVTPTSEYAKRCSELRAAGWIEDSGEDREGGAGLPRIVSKITEQGLAALRRIES